MSQQLVKEERFWTRSLTVLSCLASFQYFSDLVERKIYTAERDPSVQWGGNRALKERRLWVMLSSHSPVKPGNPWPLQAHAVSIQAVRPYYRCCQCCPLLPFIWFSPQCFSTLPAIFASIWIHRFWALTRFIFARHINRIKQWYQKSENPLRQLTSLVTSFKMLCDLKNRGPYWNVHSGSSAVTSFVSEASWRNRILVLIVPFT